MCRLELNLQRDPQRRRARVALCAGRHVQFQGGQVLQGELLGREGRDGGKALEIGVALLAERRLLANILKVMAHLGITAGQCSLADLTALEDAEAMPEQVLFMGNQPADLSATLAKRCLLLPSLNDLISAPYRKAEVWKTLCQLQQSVA